MPAKTHLVIFVMIDGLRPDAITAAACPTLQGLCQQGAWSFQAQSVMPCVTLPCHMSIFHSVPPTCHGITANVWQPMALPLPGLIDQAAALGKRCSALYNWEPLRDLSRPEALQYVWYRHNYLTHDGDDIVTDAAIDHITADTPDFCFVYLGTVDTAGHFYGWMSEDYLRQAERADPQPGRLLAALPATAHVLVQADHGGHERNHGTETPEDMTIPWLVAGPRIKRGYELTGAVSLLETAPTLAHRLDIPAPREWEGRCVTEALA